MNTKEYCKKISSAKIQQCLWEEPVFPLLPHRMPEDVPVNWETEISTSDLWPDELEDMQGFVWENDSEDDYEYHEVIPLTKGLVYVKDICFMHAGQYIDVCAKNDLIYWDGEKYVLPSYIEKLEEM